MMKHEEFVRSVAERIARVKSGEETMLEGQEILTIVGGVLCSVSVSYLREILRVPPLTPVPSAPAFIQGIFSHRGKIISVIDVEKRFLHSGTPRIPEHVMLIEWSSETHGLLFDKVLGTAIFPEESLLPIGDQEHIPIPKRYLRGMWDLPRGISDDGYIPSFILSALHPMEKMAREEHQEAEHRREKVLSLDIGRMIFDLEHENY